MTFLPIVSRELRVLSRRRSTYWVRTGSALAVIILGTWMFLAMQRESPQTISNVLFGLLTGTAELYCLFSGVRSTADSLSYEKREGTLGLLFLTDLKGYDVVLGKLVATSVNGLYGVLAVVPMLAVPLLMGGISLAEFGRMALVAVNTLFFSLCIGMFVSSISKHAQRAALGTMLLILIAVAAGPLAGWYLALLNKPRPMQLWPFYPSPGFSYYLAWDIAYVKGAKDFRNSLITIHAIGWVALILSAFIAPRSWKDRPPGVKRLRWRERWKLWSLGNSEERKTFRARLLDINAFFWLAGRSRLKPAFVWFAIGLAGCGWFWGWIRLRSEWLNYGVYLATAVILHLLIKGWFIAEVGRQLAEDRKSGALELLLSTSLTVKEIVMGQMLALARQFLGPVAALISADVIFIMAGLRDSELGDSRGIWITAWILWLGAFAADLAALFWVGLWQSVTVKNPNQAASASLIQIMVLPSIVFGLVCLVASLSSMAGHSDPGWKFFMGWWFGLGFVTDLYFGGRARKRMLSEFRVVAAQRYTPKLGFWKRLFSDQVER